MERDKPEVESLSRPILIRNFSIVNRIIGPMRNFTALLLLILLTGLFSCEKTAEESPPVAIFNIVPSTGPFTKIFTFNAHDTYDDYEPDEDLRIRWDWDGDGTFDTEYSLNRSYEHQYTEPDTYDVIMEVVNSKGWTDHEMKSLVVYADSVPPVASFFVTPDSSSVNTIFLFDASATSDQYTPLDQLQFRWDWNNDGVWDRPYTNDTSLYHKYDIPGEYRILMEVRNNISLTDTTSRKIYVYDL